MKKFITTIALLAFIVFAYGQKMEVGSGAYVTLGHNACMTVDGDLVTTNGNFTITSNANGTGSLIVTGITGTTGDITAERYVTKDIWHYVSAPVADQNITTTWMTNNSIDYTDPAYQLFRWDEDTQYWIYFNYSGTEPEDFGDTKFVTARGYSLDRTADGALSFTGSVRTGDQTYAASYTASKGEGWNLVGNPFTCSVGATSSATTTDDFIADNSSRIHASYQGLFLWDEQAGYNGSRDDYKIISNGAIGSYTQIAQDYIQPGQGFMVKVVSGGSTLEFDEDMQAHNGDDFYKNSKELWPSFDLIIENDELFNATSIGFNENMTKGLDPSYDIGKLKGNPNLALYTRLVEDNGIDFAIQALPWENMEDFVVPVGVDVAETGMFEFTAVQQNMDHYNIMLEDRELNVVTNLRWETYHAEIAQSGTGRFFLHFKDATAIGEQTLQNSITCRYVDGRIRINNPKHETGIVSLVNTMGQVLQSVQLNGEASTDISAWQPPGIYIVTIQTNKARFGQKIFIR